MLAHGGCVRRRVMRGREEVGFKVSEVSTFKDSKVRCSARIMVMVRVEVKADGAS